MTSTRPNLTIVTNGPSKYDFSVALFTGTPVLFTLDSPNIQKPKILVNILSIACEDGSREKWNISGYYSLDIKKIETNPKWTAFRGYYDSRTRIGHVITEKRLPLF